MTPAALLAQVRVVLVGPKYPENIGAAARVIANMGLGELVVVGKASAEREACRKTATHHADHVLAALRHCDTLAEAVDGCALVVGTTARQGRQRLARAHPSQLAERLLPALASGPAALVFGPEDRGLVNEELSCCGLVVTIPTDQGFPSVNLAQAVAITCYALRQGVIDGAEEQVSRLYRPRPANAQELAALFQAASSALRALDASADDDEAASRLTHLRQLLARCPLSAREAKIFKETCLQVARLALDS